MAAIAGAGETEIDEVGLYDVVGFGDSASGRDTRILSWVATLGIQVRRGRQKEV
jgi:hypothetical protein